MLKGIDISFYQNPTPSLSGLSFVVLRASISVTKDSMYDTHYAKARQAGLVVMAYHYAYPADRMSIAAQVAKFLDVAKNADFLWLDQEEAGFNDAQAQEFINLVRAAGRPCGLYHSASGFGGVNADAQWVADWRDASEAAGYPRTADGSKEYPGWDLWQYQGSPLDKDYLNPDTTLAQLMRIGYVPKPQLDAALAQKAALAADLKDAEAELQAAEAALEQEMAECGARTADLQAQLGSALNALASKQAELDTANQALAEARLSLGKWDALKRLLRELLGLD